MGAVIMMGVLSEALTMLLLGTLSDRLGRHPMLTAIFLVLRWLGLCGAQWLWVVFLAGLLRGVSLVQLTVSMALRRVGITFAIAGATKLPAGLLIHPVSRWLRTAGGAR
jgi:MFS family permease